MDKEPHKSTEPCHTDAVFQVVGHKDLHRSLADEPEKLLMGPAAQCALFGHEVKQVRAKALYQAYKDLADDLSKALLLAHPNQVGFFCVYDPHASTARWHQFAHVVHDDGREGFLKIGRGQEAKSSLRYEIRNFELAQVMGYPPVVKIITPYTETRGGLGFFEVEWVDGKEGFMTVNTLEARSLLSKEYGHIVAEIMVSSHGKSIPTGFDISEVKPADRTMTSPETFLDDLYRQEQKILSPLYLEEVEQLVGLDEYGRSSHERIEKLFDEVNKHLPAFLVEGVEEEKTYFCLNDCGPHTMLFCNEKGRKHFGSPLVVYFLGGGGSTSNKMLTSLFDWGNFWARCDPNFVMQQAFLETALQLDPLQSLERTYHFLRYTIVARSIFSISVRIDKDHPRHDIAASLLRNLFPNLQKFKEIYTKHQWEKG